MSKKKIVWLCILGVVIAAALAGVLYYIFKPDPGISVELVSPERKNVIETFDTSGTVESEEQGNFKLVNGVKVTKVNVKVGDIVKKGDVLVEFDSSSFNKTLSDKKEEYNKAKTAYEDYQKAMTEAKATLESNRAELSSAEALVAQLEKQVAVEKNAVANEEEAQKAEDKLNDLTNDSTLSSKILNWFVGSDTSLGKLMETLNKITGSGSSDLSGLLSLMDSDSAQYKLMEAQLSLASLKIKNSVLESEAKGSLLSLYKSLYEYAEKSYNEVKETIDALNGGWKAEYDGIVSELNVKAGEVYTSETASSTGGFDISSIISSVTSGNADIGSLLSSAFSGSETGLRVEYYPLTASFVIGQSDLANVKLGQEVNVTSATGNEYKGKISFISAVAASSATGGVDLGSLLGSGSAATGVEAKIEIEKPDSGVIIGLDVDISIDVNESKNALTVPVESIQYDNNNAYVFALNDGKLEKVVVEIGLFDGSYYEIISGLEENMKVVKSPTSSMAEGDKAFEKTSEG